ncbi:hypothetical protein MIND_00534600 [Mycena indigotica]|uniref:Uncharacterized protein n=1 Tax=Mycena indigotica TaxID=2126181 RepID=A0A8H6WCI5_9AGAR|nr:uncharacterized protein MIND_00534600 [Mycena indigotica]KAF7307404.1 hypothetical protein MIND_00534600 [Mycena indigotica]
MRSSAFLLLCPALVIANTEIVNFAANAAANDVSGLLYGRELEWSWLHQRTTTNWTMTPAPFGTPLTAVSAAHERWFVVDLPKRGAKKFTLRLSYPASSPTDFSVAIFDPADALIALSLSPATASGPATRRKYARIRAVDTGVLTPPFKPHSSRLIELFYSVYFPGFYSQSPGRSNKTDVQFVLTLEPLLLGVLPASLAPLAIFSIILLVVVARTMLPRISNGLENVAAEARRELAEKMKTE